jgi:hydroxymethyl cephem carbamoyltransferase
MNILGIHSGHDGAVAVVENARLTAYIEAQKDNHRRYANFTSARLDAALQHVTSPPDLVASGSFTPYHGCDAAVTSVGEFEFDGRRVPRFTTSHERAHIFCAYGLSPFEQGRPCYVLIWEGTIGTFCSIDEKCEVRRLDVPLTEPGHRYAMLYELAHADFDANANGGTMGVAGKLMALACRRDDSPLRADEGRLMNMLLGDFSSERVRKGGMVSLPFINVGVLDEPFRRFAYKFSERLFNRFYSAAKEKLKNGWPLLVVGGCGLNCEWNSKWRASGLFEDVFVPPCADDSGCAVDVAADAQRHFTGNAKLTWDVYAGETFRHDADVPATFERRALDYEEAARLLCDGAVIAWVQGKYEIGPRALGNRSLLAAPFSKDTTDRLNYIKQRESYRPVAPVCLEEQVSDWFDWRGPSPHMLYFQTVKSEKLRAVTHDDGSARTQTVNAGQNRPLYELLSAFARLTGVGVLCNTSLNYPGRGFINPPHASGVSLWNSFSNSVLWWRRVDAPRITTKMPSPKSPRKLSPSPARTNESPPAISSAGSSPTRGCRDRPTSERSSATPRHSVLRPAVSHQYLLLARRDDLHSPARLHRRVSSPPRFEHPQPLQLHHRAAD